MRDRENEFKKNVALEKGEKENCPPLWQNTQRQLLTHTHTHTHTHTQ